MMELEIPRDICTVPFYERNQNFASDQIQQEDQAEVVESGQGVINSQFLEPVLIDGHLLYTFKRLLNKYKKQMGDTTDGMIVSGGLQQYLNKQQTLQPTTSCQDGSIFHNLPVNVKLQIFSYLDPKQLCRISRVCRDWYNVSADNILWQGMLQRHLPTWEVISHTTNPAVYQETQSEWSNKEIFLRCSPLVNQLMHQHLSVMTSITNVLRYFMPKKVPKITMFGPGLESENTSVLIRKLLYEKNVLQRTGMVPGQFDGVGSGWVMKMVDGTAFQLSVLYSASKKVRQMEGWDRVQGNNLVTVNVDPAGKVIVELKPAVRDFCCTVDAFVYVFDATVDAHNADEENQEFKAMVNERWSATHVPVLVLSCVKDASSPRIPCIKVVEKIGMSNLNRPWQVRNSEATELTNVLEGLKWLVEQSQRR